MSGNVDGTNVGTIAAIVLNKRAKLFARHFPAVLAEAGFVHQFRPADGSEELAPAPVVMGQDTDMAGAWVGFARIDPGSVIVKEAGKWPD